MSTLLEQIAGLTIGSVESVSPGEIKAVLDIDAPQTTALNNGVPTGFPRLNSYVLLPNEGGAVVGLVVWLGIERSAFPKRVGLKDFGLIDLPFPIRKISLTPVGTLVDDGKEDSLEQKYVLRRGVTIFPSVGDPVLLPTSAQLRSIIESEGFDRRVWIGRSTLAGGAQVSVDPDKLFGRHLAVIGNTGSGKSCSVAGLIRWSMEAASAERESKGKTRVPNARFIILDPNGEYASTFADLGTVKIFKAPPAVAPDLPMSVPGWMWNSHEWSAFAMATAATQRPVLLQALRNLRSGVNAGSPIETRVRTLAQTMKTMVEMKISEGYNAYASFPQSRNTGELLRNMSNDISSYATKTEGSLHLAINKCATEIGTIEKSRHWTSQAKEGWNSFTEQDLTTVVGSLETLLGVLPPVPVTPTSEDAPLPFNIEDLPDHLQQLAAGSGSSQLVQFISTLVMRIRMMLADNRLKPLIGQKEEDQTFSAWLENYVGGDKAANGQIAILDLSLVPSEIIHIAIAVLARLVFEATQRYRKLNGFELPTILVLEEAHSFIHQHTERSDEAAVSPIQMCRSVFEKIAREGRKFGLGLVLSSQRPSELSPTVLAQCNTFLLHRIVNDRDQELIKKLVPDNLAGLLKELPSLPSRQAILLGGATPVPILVEVRELAPEHRPKSSDPKFWAVWTGEEERSIDWNAVAEDWTRQ